MMSSAKAGGKMQIRGVPIGSVVRVDPSLERVEVLADIRDATTVIPRNSLIEANQSGLIAEPLIDITPQLPIPTYTVRSPRTSDVLSNQACTIPSGLCSPVRHVQSFLLQVYAQVLACMCKGLEEGTRVWGAAIGL